MFAHLSKLLLSAIASLFLAGFSFLSLVGSSETTTHEERWPDGTIKAVWTEDREGRVHGTRRDFYPDGAMHSHVESDHGSWTSMWFYWPSGNLKMRCTASGGKDVRVMYDDVPQELDVSP